MKFTVARNDLDAALAVTTPAMTKSGGDISSHFVFRQSPTDPAKMEVLTYAGRVCASAQFVVAFDGENRDPFTVEARVKTFIDNVPDDTTLVFEYSKEGDTAQTKVSATKGRKAAFFPSLDPTHFPYWDKTFAEAKTTGKLPANRLQEAISVAKLFTADEQSKSQGLCVSEFRKGVLISTNRATFGMITVPGSEEMTLRFHNKDVGPLIDFLKLAKETPVEVREHSRMFFLIREDGSVTGQTRFHETFPNIEAPKGDDEYTWEIPIPLLTKAFNGLRSSAATDDDRVWFESDTNTIFLYMVSDKDKEAVWDIPIKNTPSATAKPLPGRILNG